MKRIFQISLILSVLILAMQANVLAQQDGEDISLGKYRIIHSNILNEDRTLLIHLPSIYEDTELSFPVLFVLYGHDINNYFAPAVITSEKLGRTGEIPQMIVVGVDNTNRYRDNLPVSSRDGSEGGGADNFIRLFEEELIPYIEKNYRTKNFRILAGPQAGSVFGLFALITKTDLFNAFIINNPFLSPQNSVYLYPKIEEFFGKSLPFDRFLYIKSEKDEPEGNLEHFNRFSNLINTRKPKGLNYKFDLVEPPGYFIKPLAFKEGLKHIFSEYKLPHDFLTESVNDVISYYKNLSEKYGFEIDTPELMLTFEGDKLLNRRKTGEAIELFEYLLKLYPKGLNAFWRLGETYRNLGDFEKAAYYYKGFLNIQDTDAAMIHSRLRMVERYINESAVYLIELEIKSSGLEAGLKKYRELKSDPDNKRQFFENDFNGLGYRLMGSGKIKEAIEIFKIMVEMYPESANAYDSLGEAYMNNGDKEQALKNYKKSLELNPGNSNAREMLKRLEGK